MTKFTSKFWELQSFKLQIVCKLKMSNFYGPQLPSNLKEGGTSINDEIEKKNAKRNFIGPALPPGFKQCVNEEREETLEEKCMGPCLPPGFKESNDTPKDNDDGAQDKYQDEDEHEHEDEDTNVYGPMLPGSHSKVEQELENRARAIRRKLVQQSLEDKKNDELKREAWMVELPPARSGSLGLGARSFRSKQGPDMSDRSSWTDTPQEKHRKEEMKLMGMNDEKERINYEEEAREAANSARDEFMEKQLKKSNKKRSEKSLLELHQEKLERKKKKKEKKGDVEERRPFSREIDLQVNKFDEAQKKSVIKKASLLNDRFSRGESKFL